MWKFPLDNINENINWQQIEKVTISKEKETIYRTRKYY